MTEAAQPVSRLGRTEAFGIVLIYAVFAALWILLSDSLVKAVFDDPELITLASMLKGWLFVAVTSLLLYGLMRRRFGQGERTAAPESLRPLAGVLPFLLLGAVILILTATGVVHAYLHRKETEVVRLQAIADLKTRQIGDWLAERRGDAEFSRTSPFFAERYRRWREQGDAEAGEQLRERLEQVGRNGGFAAVSLFAPEAKPLWRSQEAPDDIAPALRRAVLTASASRQVGLVGPYRGLAGRVRLDLAVPLAAAVGPAPVIVLHIDPAIWLFPTLQTWPAPSATGETLLFRRDGEAILFLNELRHRKDTAAKLRVPLTESELVAAQALRTVAGAGQVLEGVDYRGEPVLGVAKAVPGSAWYMMAKLDQSELAAEVAGDAAWISLAGVLALAMAGAALFLLRQRQQLAMARLVQASQSERLRALRLLDAIAEGSDDAIFAKDTQGRYLLFNRAAGQFVGRSPASVLGLDDRAVFGPEQGEALMAMDRQVMAEGRVMTREERLTLPTGEAVFLATKGPLRDETGQVAGLFGVSRDITARHRAEAALRESEGRFRALVEQSLAGIYIIQDGRFRYVNPGFAAIFGYASPDDLIDVVPVSALVAPGDRERVAENVRRRVEGETTDIHYTFIGLRRDGSQIDVEVHGRAFEYEGRPAVIGLILDITSRKAAEDSLRASELRFHDIANASADWVWEVDAEGRYTYASESVQDLLGYTPDEILGRTPFDLMPAEEAERVRAQFADLCARRVPFRELDNVNLRKDGAIRHVQTNGMPILDAAGNLLGYRGLDRDVTEKKQADDALRRLADDMAATLQAIPDLLFEVDETGQYINVRATREQLLAAPPDRLLGHTVSEMLPPAAAATVMAALVGAASNGVDYGRIIALPLVDGVRYFELSVSRKSRREGDRPCFIVLSRDVTERKRGEAELTRHNQELERFNRAMIDRELDMIDLKRKVNELACRLGEPAPFSLAFLDERDAPGGRT